VTSAAAPPSPADVSTVLCDLDGVVWLAHQPITGAVDAVAALRATGRRVLFVTNNSSPLLADHEGALANIGIPAAGDVVSSAMAGAHLVEPGMHVLVSGGPGVVEAVERRGATVVLNDGTPVAARIDAVVVGLHRDFDYARLAVTTTALRAGARLIGTNDDSTYPTPDGLLPGAGSILAAIATAGGAEPVIGGKPHQPMADLVAEVLGHGRAGFDPRSTLVVGDRADTDGEFARRLGSPFALVRTGVTPPGLAVDVPVAIDAADLAGVAAALGATG
jgi:HAD superfamily hydrolase (TIGR01450 family)